MTRRLLTLAAATVAVTGGLALSAAPASACTPDYCPRGPLCPYVSQLCLKPF
ncbi:MAG TPA: hypothetical protein VFQ85_02465 [Mycobacteriales bacterium]|jgi:hypothetical protein|nr:hypothetical protein [Mycobacteriales bacterium]